jgi:hypothetical protein
VARIVAGGSVCTGAGVCAVGVVIEVILRIER